MTKDELDFKNKKKILLDYIQIKIKYSSNIKKNINKI